MKTNSNEKHPQTLLGIVLNVVALLMYNFWFESEKREQFILFSVFAIAVFYFVVLVLDNAKENKLRLSKIPSRLLFLLLCLLTISCFSVNLGIQIFSVMPTWLQATFVVCYLSLGAQIYFPDMPPLAQKINMVFLGVAIILGIYFSLYLMPLYPIAFIGLLVFGLTFHLFVPVFFVISLINHIIRIKARQFDYAFLAIGIAIPIIVLFSYTYKYRAAVEKVHAVNASIITRPDNNLPEWVLLSQTLDNDPITETLIHGDLTYDTGIDGGWFSPNIGSFAESKLHNPFFTLAKALSPDVDINRDDRVKILKTLFGERHKATAKLWSGKDLSTSDVLTNIRIYPDYRMAYMEKIISIKNNNKYEWNQQEALYSFILPEGSVASSLSLWINGKEEKSRLTTKAKADSAYTTIVGVEVRDPSVMHWQEGNRLIVNVFPCTPKENRRFKIGVSIPLKAEGKRLSLENIRFEGPVMENTHETTLLIFEGTQNIDNMDIPGFYDKNSEREYQYTGSYVDDWKLSFDAPDYAKNAFSFGGYSYNIDKLTYQNKPINTNKVYLDINSSWTEDEFVSVMHLLKDKSVYVYRDKLTQLTKENSMNVFEKLSTLNFSLFPINTINGNGSLIISKSTKNAPNYNELKESQFIESIANYISISNQDVYLYNIGTQLSPYLKTLTQFRVVNYHEGSIENLESILSSSQFPVEKLAANEISLPVSGLKIRKTEGVTNTGSPDHLMRLYAYNKTVQEAGRNYFNEQYIQKNLIDLAEEAYIVSPVSSMIVLETIKDYERFDIEENKNSLGNASANGHGGVPEPHEWALIIISILVVLIVTFKNNAFLKQLIIQLKH